MKRAGVVCGLLLLPLLFAAGAAVAEERESALALGDSVVFGFIAQAGHAYVNASNFIGSPQYVGDALHVNVANAGCPGEATTSFLSSTGADHGCRAFRQRCPLHVSYGSTQLAYAESYVRHHRALRLITVGLGANDLFLLEDACATSQSPQECVAAGLPSVLSAVGSNMAAILAALRADGYGGVILVVNYYSPDYSDETTTAITAALNEALAAPARAYGADVADVFAAFKRAASSPAVAGKVCDVGLLNVDPQDPNQCDVHPSQSGQRLIAESVVEAFRAASR
jgi:lysophospholipase L1-like esterase